MLSSKVMIVLMTVMRAMMMAIRAMMMRMLCILLVSKVGGLAALAIGSTTAVLAPRFSLIGNIFCVVSVSCVQTKNDAE